MPEGSVQSFLVQPSGEMVGHLYIVQVGEREVGVAFQSYLRQMYHRGIAAILIDEGSPLAHQAQATRPFVEFGAFVGLGEVVSVIDDDGYLGELHERVHRHLYAFSLFGERNDFTFFRHLSLGEGYVRARLIGDDGLYVFCFGQGEPAYSSSLRVCHEYGGAYGIEQRGIGVGVEFEVYRSDGGCHLAEVLVECFFVTAELYAFEVVGPDAQAEAVEPFFFVEVGG